MGSIYSIRRKAITGIIVMALPLLFGAGFDMYAALLTSLGFGASISLWRISVNHQTS